MASTAMAATSTGSTQAETLAPVTLPRVTIEFCTQCKWMLRAAYVSNFLFLGLLHCSGVFQNKIE